MADIKLQFTGDLNELKAAAAESSKLIKKFQKVNERTLKNVQKTHIATAREITKVESIEQKKRESLESRLLRRRARNRLKAFKQRRQEEIREARDRERIARQSAKAIEMAERAAARRRSRIRAGIVRGVSRGIGVAGAGAGISAVFQGREILKFDESLARASAQAKISIEDQMGLKNAINETSIALGLQRGTILETLSEIVDKSGDIRLASDNLIDLTKIIRGTGADSAEVGQLISSIKNAFKGSGQELTSSEIVKFIEILIAQGDNAQITLANLAGSGEKLFGAFKGAGLRSKKDFISFGALIQTAGEAGGAEEAATAAVRFLSELTAQQNKLKQFGINVFRPGTKGELKDVDVIIKNILEKTGGDVSKLQSIFTERAIKPIQILAAEYRNTGGEIKSFTDLLDAGANATDNINTKFERVQMTSAQGFAQLGAMVSVFSDVALSPILGDLSDFFKALAADKEAIAQINTSMRGIAATLKAMYDITTAPFKLVGAVSEVLAEDFLNQDIRRNRASLKKAEEQARQYLPGFSSSVETGTRGGSVQTGPIGVTVNNNITTDSSGRVKDVNTIINADRGKFVEPKKYGTTF